MELLIMGTFMIVSFYLGFILGYKKINKEKIEIPTLNPVKIIRESKDNKEETERARKEQEIMDINLANIDIYDGTSVGQKDFLIRR